MYGVTKDGFSRKDYLDIISDMNNLAKQLFGEDINLSENSPMGMFLQVIAWEMSNLWEEVENSHHNNSSLNAIGAHLDDAVSNFGRTRFLGTRAKGEIKINGENGTKIKKGFIVGTTDDLLYEVLNDATVENGSVSVPIQAVEIGESYNVPANTITKIINPVAGVASVCNVEPTENGGNVESDASLRERHLQALREPTTGDNISQYKLWAKEISGVGQVKVQPTTPIKGYVTLILSDENSQPAGEPLLQEVRSYIDAVRPVNAGVYVLSATPKVINIEAKVKLALGHQIQNIKEVFEEDIKDYFRAVSLRETYVSHAQIGQRLLGTTGVIDYTELLLNGSISNTSLTDTEIPIIGEIELEVI